MFYGTSKRLRAMLLAGVAIATLDGALAQSNGAAVDDSETVVVTAQKREQKLQKVPIAISAFSAADLEKRGVKSAEDLQYFTPGLTMSANNVNNSKMILRGVGAENPVIGGDPGVSFNMDGHYLQSGAFLTRDFLDVARIEVLRGPQGTLYGRNAVGGAINVITRKPSDVLEIEGSLTYGSYNRRLAQLAVGGPIAAGLTGRIAASAEKRDGYMTNIVTGQELNDSDYLSVRGALHYDVGDAVQLDLSAYYSKDNSESATLAAHLPYTWAPVIYSLYPSAGTTVNPTVADPQQVAFDDTVAKSDETEGVFFDVAWDWEFATFKSMTAWSRSRFSDMNQDLDLSPLHIATQNLPLRFETLTQEFQLSSSGEGPLTWVVGAFLYDETSSYTLDVQYHYLGLLIPGGQNLTFGPNDLKSRSYAVYGQADYFLTDELQVVAGLRYTYDEKELVEATYAPGLGIRDPITLGPKIDGPSRNHWDQFNYKIGVNWFPMEDVLVYASLSTGYKAGGYQAGGSGGRSYNPEKVEAWEVGLKSQWFDRRLTANLSAFFYDYTDKQEYRRPPVGVTFIENAGKATSQGVELELTALPVEGLRLDASVSLLDATYDEFSSIDETNPRATGTPYACVPIAPATGCPIDVAGNRLTRSPKWKVGLGVEYTTEIGNAGRLTARFNTVWLDKQFTRPFNTAPFIIDSYWRSGARLIWTLPDDHYEVMAFVDNIEGNNIPADRETNPSFALFAARGTFLPPRTFGVRFSVNL